VLAAVVIVLLCAAAAVAQAPRWLRVAQREHYLAGSTIRFASRWWGSSQANLLLVVAVLTSGLSAFSLPFMAVVAAGITVAAPLGLGLRGRTSPLAWTRRLKTTAAVLGVLDAALFTLAGLTPARAPLGALLCFLQPAILDVALRVTAPFERLAARRYVRTAEAKLRSVHPTTVAITGSYGKTTTKVYLRHLASAARSVLASPASFNNTGGLSRTLNEHLTPGTEVFVAEMGTFGPGEIRSMCRWVQPDVAAIVNIGPVHLERMKTLDGIVAAKGEIFEQPVTRTAVLNIDAHGLAGLADQLAERGKRVIRVSAVSTSVDVCVRPCADGDAPEVLEALEVFLGGELRHRIAETSAQPANVAAALGLALALELPVEVVLPRLDSLPENEHRQQVVRTPKGVTVIDNTFSSNPASAKTSLALLDRLAARTGRAVVVTPGMVELGRQQFEENRQFAIAADDVATDFVIVGVTNRKALLAGALHRDMTIHKAPTRDAAVAWVRQQLRDGDAVLYENDLPDHYP
jgi:UDP-N-acetylmuramoyl-tripeptide--D-alanyl-D-alanine ligase